MESNEPVTPARAPASRRPVAAPARPAYPEQPYVPSLRPDDSAAPEPSFTELAPAADEGIISSAGSVLAKLLGIGEADRAAQPPVAATAAPAVAAAGGSHLGATSSSTASSTATATETQISSTGTLVWDQSTWEAGVWAQ